MKVVDLFRKKKTIISFEIFPPKHDVHIDSIYNTLELFKELVPDFMSVTYGAGGSSKDRTIEIATKIKNELNLECMAHFTCVGHTEEEIDEMLGNMKKLGLENILALRGDPPNINLINKLSGVSQLPNQLQFDYSKNKYEYAYELIRHIRTKNDFCIAAAAYAEGHVESIRLKEDIMYLKQKVDEGVDFLVTQLFFDNRIFYDFLDKALANNIACPITAGVMPIFKAEQIKSITARSGCSIPAKLVLMMDKYSSSPDDLRKAGIEYGAKQIRDLIDNKVDGIHIYTMNRPKSTKEILKAADIL